jgi:hypothetical protein
MDQFLLLRFAHLVGLMLMSASARASSDGGTSKLSRLNRREIDDEPRTCSASELMLPECAVNLLTQRFHQVLQWCAFLGLDEDLRRHAGDEFETFEVPDLVLLVEARTR